MKVSWTANGTNLSLLVFLLLKIQTPHLSGCHATGLVLCYTKVKGLYLVFVWLKYAVKSLQYSFFIVEDSDQLLLSLHINLLWTHFQPHKSFSTLTWTLISIDECDYYLWSATVSAALMCLVYAHIHLQYKLSYISACISTRTDKCTYKYNVYYNRWCAKIKT